MATILIVEDDPDIRETLTEILQGERYTVLTAAHGEEALTILTAVGDLPQVILLDLRMPVMDGREFRLRIRLHPQWREIPVVVYSGTPDFCPPGDLEPLVANLIKPVEIPLLLSVLRGCCRAREARPGSAGGVPEGELPGLGLVAA